jgi:hypothetical protein
MSSRADPLGCGHDHTIATGNGSFQAPVPHRGHRPAARTGAYEIISDEEMIEGLSFPCFRRVATMIMVPGAPPQRSTMEMVSISPADLSHARRIDASTPHE